ncbi:symbiotic chitinase [Colletotrichum karsti]|uniref:chitinase n=1 Tax=Colletotrichum karsti TaxID=1095194 RepID=A0A9P6IA72_9PEZI|nr:symbiotic chitinase [Colletotrichum karsti]KAF9876816.1 symbiotic chitinase [Colletotrichum karsti]
MDSATPADLFKTVTAVKDLNPKIEVWLSVGGWTFSDNNTVTQPLLGEISRSSEKRKQFANNVVTFLEQYGFDGVDIDWEYPGAPDRGGKEDDTKNFVSLFKTLRETFDASGRHVGLTFTIPSSYWYLKWFDVPGLLKYADWTNLMSYDLHGVWDSNNPIGSIVQGHTNLTEIKRAAELLWRNDIAPDQVALGFGFYGRAFTLQDPACTQPGCPFSGGANKGSCTATSGYLSHYEIKDILDKNPGIKPVWDKEAAVKYFSWDSNQWISYDDTDTYKQKVTWANEVGFSGSLIWASDLDDYEYTAHSGLLGRKVPSNAAIVNDTESAASTESLKRLPQFEGDFTKLCRIADSCVDIGQNSNGWCKTDENPVGWDEAKCDGGKARAICCKSSNIEYKCQWRGGGADCNGQCHAGEINLFPDEHSKPGGGFETEDDSSCNRGWKVFCCESPDWSPLTKNCYWSGCGEECKSGEQDVAYAADLEGKCRPWSYGNHYCCKTDFKPFNECHWVGKGDCADNTCAGNEVTLATNPQGDSWVSCSWWRKKSLCCSPTSLADADCSDVDLCSVEPWLCESEGDDGEDDDDDATADLLSLRSIPGEDEDGYCDKEDFLDWVSTPGEDEYHHVEKRSREYKVNIWYRAGKLQFPKAVVIAKPAVCYATDLALRAPKAIIDTVQSDHVVDLQYARAMLRGWLEAILPDGTAVKDYLVDLDSNKLILDNWNSYALPASLGTIGMSNKIWLTAEKRFGDTMGSVLNPKPLVLLFSTLNGLKGRIFGSGGNLAGLRDGMFSAPILYKNAYKLAEKALQDPKIAKELITTMRNTIVVWKYINRADITALINGVRLANYAEVGNFQTYLPGARSSWQDVWRQVDYTYYDFAARESKDWIINIADAMMYRFSHAAVQPDHAAWVINSLRSIYTAAEEVVVPNLISPK